MRVIAWICLLLLAALAVFTGLQAVELVLHDEPQPCVMVQDEYCIDTQDCRVPPLRAEELLARGQCGRE